MGSQIVKKYKGVNIFFSYIPGPKNPAEIASKEVDDPLTAVDSVLWWEGQPEFLNSGVLRKNANVHICEGTYKVLKEHKSSEEMDEVAANSNAVTRQQTYENCHPQSTTAEYETEEGSLPPELDIYRDKAIKEQGFLLQRVMSQYHGCFWKRKTNSWGDQVTRSEKKCTRPVPIILN